MGLVACGGSAGDGRPPIENAEPTVTSIEIAELDVYEGGSDTFAACPPVGRLGQSWVPPVTSGGGVSDGASVSFAIASTSGPGDGVASGERPRGRAEHVLAQLRSRFRDCWHRGLFDDPTQNGHVALAMRVAADGQVSSVESYGACELSTNVVTCLRDTAKSIRFAPSAEGDTVVVPLVFADGAASVTASARNDAYTADAYLALEAARPALRACASAARKDGGTPTASATFLLDVDSAGRVVHTHVDQFSGDKGELVCAARAIAAVVFPKPPHGQASITARVAVDPPSGSK